MTDDTRRTSAERLREDLNDRADVLAGGDDQQIADARLMLLSAAELASQTAEIARLRTALGTVSHRRRNEAIAALAVCHEYQQTTRHPLCARCGWAEALHHSLDSPEVAGGLA